VNLVSCYIKTMWFPGDARPHNQSLEAPQNAPIKSNSRENPQFVYINRPADQPISRAGKQRNTSKPPRRQNSKQAKNPNKQPRKSAHTSNPFLRSNDGGNSVPEVEHDHESTADNADQYNAGPGSFRNYRQLRKRVYSREFEEYSGMCRLERCSPLAMRHFGIVQTNEAEPLFY
jgi:hypothetical protein